MNKSSLKARIGTAAPPMRFECLKDELKELYDYNRTSGNIYLAWFSLHWTVNLGVLAACLSSYEKVQPLLKEIAVTFVFLNVLSVVACIFVLKFVNKTAKRVGEILTYLNSTLAALDDTLSTAPIELRSAYPHVLSIAIMWLTQSTIWILVLLWVLVFLKIGLTPR